MLLAFSRKLSVRGTLLRGGALEMPVRWTFNVCPRGLGLPRGNLGEALGGVQRTTRVTKLQYLGLDVWSLTTGGLQATRENGHHLQSKGLDLYIYDSVRIRDNIEIAHLYKWFHRRSPKKLLEIIMVCVMFSKGLVLLDPGC